MTTFVVVVTTFVVVVVTTFVVVVGDNFCCCYCCTVATTITRPPAPQTPVYQNKTALIYCTASYDMTLDLVYVWTFSGKIIDITGNAHYELVSNINHQFCGYNIHTFFFHKRIYSYIYRHEFSFLTL